MKWLFLAIAIGLISSTALGLWMAFPVSRSKRLLLGPFALGCGLPLILLALQPG